MSLPSLPSTRVWKLCACALLLVLPGAFIALPLICLARRWRQTVGG